MSSTLIHSPQQKPRILGPRALAILSCALALLAAQPVTASSSTSAPSPVVRVTGAEAVLASTETSSTTTNRKNRNTTPQQHFTAARRLHILATVEILHRLLAFELRAPDHHISSALLFATLELCTLDRPSLSTPRPPSIEHPELSPEQQFSLTRCLLAPPAA